MFSQASRSSLIFSPCKPEAVRAMATPHINNTRRTSFAMGRTAPWIQSQGIPADVYVKVGDANFSLHKFMLVAKSNYIRKLVMGSRKRDVTKIDLSDIPGGSTTFEKVVEFCYGVNFEITVQNVAALHCAAEYLQMTDHYCDNNLAGRTDEFLSHVGLSSLSSSVTVLRSCKDLLPMAEELKIVDRCIDVASWEACKEADPMSRFPANWWIDELIVLDVAFFGRIIRAMGARGAKTAALAGAIMTYTERTLRDLVRHPTDPDLMAHQCELVETIVALLPSEKDAFPVNFLCCLLRFAISVKASTGCNKELEKRTAEILEHATVDDLLVLSCTYDGERLSDLESVRRIVSAFVEKEKNVTVFDAENLTEICSAAMQRVAKMVDEYLCEIATYRDLSISKFTAYANLVPKEARTVDDDVYRAVDIYLKAHPDLDEVEQEKVCSVMDPLKLSQKARVHVSQNKRLPIQIVLQTLYHDHLEPRGGTSDSHNEQDSMSTATTTRSQALADITLVKENEELRSELSMMRMYITDLQKTRGEKKLQKRPTFFSSISKSLGKLNPFRQSSKDTSCILDESMEVKKPKIRRFSIS
ncbi:hypothetical protein SAY87_013124 [Trapa incisa]|uniref:Root phototropism protein 2 n=1 Tax=Trapa incisa TaxID=236973 RepID=A0AAN7KGJ2_9MYRT|nr:hypothetical protein SAY87_013124 [Trapa incisa]